MLRWRPGVRFFASAAQAKAESEPIWCGFGGRAAAILTRHWGAEPRRCPVRSPGCNAHLVSGDQARDKPPVVVAPWQRSPPVFRARISRKPYRSEIDRGRIATSIYLAAPLEVYDGADKLRHERCDAWGHDAGRDSALKWSRAEGTRCIHRRRRLLALRGRAGIGSPAAACGPPRCLPSLPRRSL